MRVTSLSSLPPQRGISRYTTELLSALADRADVDVEALGFSSLYPRFAYPGGAPERDGDESTPVPARRALTWYNPLSWIWAGLTVRGDVVHAQWWSWFLAAPYVVVLTLARLRGKRVVLTVHNVRPHETERWKCWLSDLVLRWAHHIIVHSQRNKDDLVRAGTDGSRITVVPHGVLSVTASASQLTREDARRSLCVAPDARVVLCFGNLRPYKGIDVIMEAASIARRSLPALHVIVAGELWKGCPDPAVLAHRFGIQRHVTCRLGYIPDGDAAALFAAADLVVLPYTRFDGQSGAGTLALSAGRAMIVTEAGGLPDLVRDPRAVVPPGDAPALAGALVRVLGENALREKLERDAVLVRGELAWDRIAQATVDVYRKVLRGRRTGYAGASNERNGQAAA
jgi:glycosyltransferase involved in cell wall biosynthesis